MKKIKRIYIPYWDWEDFKNGMWKVPEKSQYDKLLHKAIKFTSDWKQYGDAMQEVIIKWPNTMLHNLTNHSVNKRAFLGHCACSYKLNLPEFIVRIAWKNLTEKQRNDADKIAQLVIDEWVVKNLKFINENSNECKIKDLNQLNFYDKINEYIKVWEKRCYKNGIPDDVPNEIFNKAPSYRKITLAILKNDYPLKSLGFLPPKSKYYNILKQIELQKKCHHTP